MNPEHTITLGSILFETLLTGIIMTLVLGGFGLLTIIRVLKNKIVVSKEELFAKDGDSNLQMLLYGILWVTISLWHNIYHENLYIYINHVQLFFNIDSKNIEVIDFFPVLMGVFLFISVFGGNFSKRYATQRDSKYIIEFNKYDKRIGLMMFLIIAFILFVMFTSEHSDLSVFYSLIFSVSALFLGLIALLYFFKTKVLFDSETIEFHTFWKRKEVVYWKNVESMIYSDNSRQVIILKMKNDKKYNISTRFTGLDSFISTYKIRNRL
jgi:hypothetical protein